MPLDPGGLSPCADASLGSGVTAECSVPCAGLLSEPGLVLVWKGADKQEQQEYGWSVSDCHFSAAVVVVLLTLASNAFPFLFQQWMGVAATVPTQAGLQG